MRTLLVVTLVVAGCGQDLASGAPDANLAMDPTLENIQRRLFTPSCGVSGCHSGPDPEMKLDLGSAAASCAGLVRVPACLFHDRMRVLPGDPPNSFLYQKLTGQNLGGTPDVEQCGDDHKTSGQMPPAAPVADDVMELVRVWIAAGAPCDSHGIAADAGVPPMVDAGDAHAAAVVGLTGGATSVPAGGSTVFTVAFDAPTVAGQILIVEVDDATVLHAAAATPLTPGLTTTTFEVDGLRPSRPVRLRARLGASMAEASLAVSGLVLAEVLFNPVGFDDGLEWIVVENTTTVPIDLAPYSLGSGSSSYTYTTAQLAGTVAPGACFTIGGPLSSTANASPNYSQLFHFLPNLPNGGSVAAGTGLFDVPASQLAAATVPLDAVVYDGASSALVGADGNLATPIPGTVPAGSSVRRASMTTWEVAATPTPNGCPLL